jgi:hypothetical protein
VLHLPKCTPSAVEALHQKLGRGETPDLGSELILAAWIVREKSNELAYLEWEKATVRAHLADIML